MAQISLKPDLLISMTTEMSITSIAFFNSLEITPGLGEAKAKAMCSLHHPHSVLARIVKSK